MCDIERDELLKEFKELTEEEEDSSVSAKVNKHKTKQNAERIQEVTERLNQIDAY